MSNSSIIGGDPTAGRASGRDADLLGPSDTSDSGSDIQGARSLGTDPDNPAELGALVPDLDSDSDAFGTGERASAAGDSGRDGGDILPDRIIEAPDVDDDVLVDRNVTGDLEDVANDESGDDTDDDTTTDVDAVDVGESAGHATASGDPAGRVFTLPPGTIESSDDSSPSDR